MKKKLLFILIPVIVILITSGIVLGSWLSIRDGKVEPNNPFQGYTVIDLEDTNNDISMEAFKYREAGFIGAANSTSYSTSFSVVFALKQKTDGGNTVPYNVIITLNDENNILTGATVTSSCTENDVTTNNPAGKALTISNITSNRNIIVTYTITTDSSHYDDIFDRLEDSVNYKRLYLTAQATSTNLVWSANKVIGLTTTLQNYVLIDKPTPHQISFVYNGTEQYYYESNVGYSITNNTRTNAGTQNGTVSLNEGYRWSDDTDDDLPFTFTIDTVVLTITANAHSITYGDAPTNNGVNYSGFVNGETSSSLGGTLTYSYSYTQYGNVGTYAITPGGLTSSNYNISFVSGTLTINKKVIGVAWGSTSFTYNKQQQKPSATATGVVNDDAVNVTVTGAQTDAGTYTATASSIDNNNYTLTGAAGLTVSFTINKVTPTIVNFSFKKAYDGEAPVKKTGEAQYVFSDTDTTTVGGSFTFSSTSLSFGTNSSATKTISVYVTFTPNSSFSTNYNSVTVSKNVTVYAVAKIGSTYYGSIVTAVSSAVSGNTINVISGLTEDDGTTIHVIPINSNITLINGVTLALPYNTSGSTKDYSSDKNVSPVRVTLVRVGNSSTITVNSGATLTIGAILGTSGIKGSFSELSLNSNSSITVDGTLNAYGKITETNGIVGTSYTPVCYDNSHDSNRFVHITSTGSLSTSLAFYDAGSGSTLTGKISANVCPAYKYNFPALQTYVKISTGGKLDGLPYLDISGTTMSDACKVIYPSSYESSGKSMFFQESGDICIEYCNANKTILFLNGTVRMGSLYMSKMGYTIDTATMYVPFSSLYSIFIGGTFNTNSKSIKFLPGCYVKILNNATINVFGTSGSNGKSELLFYQGDTLTNLGITAYGSSAAICINNGTINLNAYAGIGGYIQTERTDEGATIDLRNVTDSSNISVVTHEYNTSTGATTNIAAIDLSGPFYDGNNSSNNYMTDTLFTVGELYNSYDGHACWEGEIIEMVNMSLTVLRTGALHEGFNYSIYTNTTASNTNSSTLVENVTTVRSQDRDLTKGLYIKIVDTASQSISVNGNSYISGTWIQLTEDIVIEITPTASFKVTCNHTNGTSGAGSIKRKIYMGSSSSNMSVAASSDKGGEISANVPYGWYFKVEDNASVSGTSKVIKTTYDSNGTATQTTLSQTSGSLAWSSSTVYTADGDYLFTSDNVNCVVEGTKITMFDGSSRNVEDIQIGDLLRTWNFETGAYSVQPVILIEEQTLTCELLTIYLSDGKQLTMCYGQSFFDNDLRDWIKVYTDNINDYIGHVIMVHGEEGVSFASIIDYSIVVQEATVYELITAFDYNFYADGIMTATPLIPNSVFFAIDDNYKYDEELMAQDIAEYGLYTYEEFSELLTYEQFLATNTPYWKIAVAKGYCDESYVYEVISMFLDLEHLE